MIQNFLASMQLGRAKAEWPLLKPKLSPLLLERSSVSFTSLSKQSLANGHRQIATKGRWCVWGSGWALIINQHNGFDKKTCCIYGMVRDDGGVLPRSKELSMALLRRPCDNSRTFIVGAAAINSSTYTLTAVAEAQGER